MRQFIGAYEVVLGLNWFYVTMIVYHSELQTLFIKACETRVLVSREYELVTFSSK